MDDLVTISTFFYPHETGLPCSLLESEGIECVVQGELAGPYTPVAVSGIRLQVRRSDELRAVEILKKGGFIQSV